MVNIPSSIVPTLNSEKATFPKEPTKVFHNSEIQQDLILAFPFPAKFCKKMLWHFSLCTKTSGGLVGTFLCCCTEAAFSFASEQLSTTSVLPSYFIDIFMSAICIPLSWTKPSFPLQLTGSLFHKFQINFLHCLEHLFIIINIYLTITNIVFVDFTVPNSFQSSQCIISLTVSSYMQSHISTSNTSQNFL